MRALLLLSPFALLACATGRPLDAPPKAPAGIRQKTASMQTMPGFLPLHWDASTGTLWLEIAELERDLLYVPSLPAGLGSNDVGLDRGQLGQERVVRFVRAGDKVLLVAPNLAFRASGSAAERTAVADSFAISTLAGFEVGAEESGRVLVDATKFFVRDAHGVAETLQRTGQGSFALDAERSAVWLPNTRNFPDNTEVEVLLTFRGSAPGAHVRAVAPDPTAVTLRVRHSLIRLPEPGYVPREFDPRAGYFSVGFADYSAPLGQPMQRRYLTRHRLERVDPTAARGPVVEPIVYHLDPATPEPMRTALLEGARWWAEAFDAAGFVDAFRVELLPEGADPMDVRYHVIQWVHRSTRGWSYGSSVVDPRTGEILKGHVSLGSLRVRQDWLIAEGLLAPYADGAPADPRLERFALARLRQLAAHEVGHTLGLVHNYVASAADRASVMDYPYPLVALRDDGTIDTERAYAVGIGAWDEVAITYGYAQFPPGADERRELDAILASAAQRGLTLRTDQDARPAGSVHPATHLWDNGRNAVDELLRLLEVRAAALQRFGENAIPAGRPMATLEEALVPLYLMHRYQIEAVAKSIAGSSYTYALRGDGQAPRSDVPAAEQRRALDALLGCLAPERLRLPDAVLQAIPPRPAGFERHRELFDHETGMLFDALAPARATAELVLSLVCEPSRAARLVQQQASDPGQPGLIEVLRQVLSCWQRTPADARDAALHGVVCDAALAHVLGLAADETATTQVRAEATAELLRLRRWLEFAPGTEDERLAARRAFAMQRIARFLEHPREFVLPRRPTVPPGQPIGAGLSCCCDH